MESSLIPRRTYQLTLLADNDRTIRSLATTPGITEASISQSEDVPCSRSLTFTFKNVIYPEHVRMEVGFHYDNSIHWAEIGHVAQLEHNLAEQEMSVRMSPRNLLAEVYPPRPEDTIGIHPLNWTPRVLCHELDNEIILIRYVHFGPEWTAVRPFWPVNPFNISDVENGLGFFGAVRRDSFSFTVIQ